LSVHKHKSIPSGPHGGFERKIVRDRRLLVADKVGTKNLMPINLRLDSDTRQQADATSKWVLVGVLFVIGMLNYGVRTSIASVYPLLKTDLGFTDPGLGAIGSFFLWSYALASPFAGHLGDRLDRGRMVLWSLIGWSLVTIASGLVNARWELLAMRVLLGLVESLFLPAAMALVAEYHPAKTRATALGVMGVGQYIGLIGGATFVGFLADRHGWRPSLWVLGIAGLLFAIPTYLLVPMKKPGAVAGSAAVLGPAPNPGLSFGAASIQLLKIPSFLVLAAAGALTSIGAWIFLNWLPLYFKEAFAMSLAGAGFYGASFINGSAAASQVLGGIVSDRVARKGAQYRMPLQGVLILAATPTLLVFACTKRLLVIVVALTLNSAFRTAADLNILPLLCDLAGEDKVSIAFGITNMVNCLAGGLGIFVAGLLKSSLGLAGVFAGTVGILIFDTLMLFVGYWVFLKGDLQKASLSVKAVAVPSPLL
jgi:MFS family permease